MRELTVSLVAGFIFSIFVSCIIYLIGSSPEATVLSAMIMLMAMTGFGIYVIIDVCYDFKEMMK